MSDQEHRETTDPIHDNGAAATTVKFRTNTLFVEVIEGPDVGTKINVPGPGIRIGSDRQSCDFVLRDSAVSRLHLEVRIERDKLRVIDADSRNGTILDDVAIHDAYARPESILRIGNSRLRFQLLREVSEIPMSANAHFGELRGRSVAMRLLFAKLERVAQTDLTVLIEGETGTGKDLAARAIYAASAKRDRPFVVLDCTMLNENLFESLAFGHKQGSFTGATADRVGLFEEADGGTLFLDEIGELPLNLQSRLLRVLQEGQFRRLGENRFRKVNARIVAATNRTLVQEVERGYFRADLYYRLAEATARMPPLRETPEDIPFLARHFEGEFSASVRLSEEVVREFVQRPWPGNARQLRSAVRVACALGTGIQTAPTIATTIHANVDLGESLLDGRKKAADAHEKAYVQAALQQTGGNVSRAAEIAGISRPSFYDAMARHGLKNRE